MEQGPAKDVEGSKADIDLPGEISNQFRELFEGWKRATSFLHDLFERLASVDWLAALDGYQSNLLALAEAGWTLPGWIDVRQVWTLAVKSPEEIDDFMTAQFMENGAQKLETLRQSLLECAGLSRWHPLIIEVIDSIKEGRHRVAIPSTITILDGFIAAKLVEISLSSPNNPSPFKALVKTGWHKEHSFHAFFWKSGMLFLEKLFEKRDFAERQPTLVNRHWVLHGRSSVDWTTADALRLANSL